MYIFKENYQILFFKIYYLTQRAKEPLLIEAEIWLIKIIEKANIPNLWLQYRVELSPSFCMH